jgi:hypothetical protein
MTFLEIQNRVMARTNLSSDVARERIKGFINERCRDVQTTVNLGSVRRGTVTATTTSGSSFLTPSGIIKPLTITFPEMNRVLGERSMDQMRVFDSALQWIGAPELYAVYKVNPSSIELFLEPQPDSDYDLTIDAVMRGADLTADDDVPGFPEDYHDILVFGALADELDHLEKQAASMKAEKKYATRLGELRYFIQKSIYMHRMQSGYMMSNWEWWFYGSPWVR